MRASWGSHALLVLVGIAAPLAAPFEAGSMLDNLKVAGVDPKAIDTILISRFHPDHIDGIKTKDGAKVFPNAEIFVPQPEWTFWMDDSNMGPAQGTVKRDFLNPRRIFRDIAKRFKPRAEVAPGIVSVPASGHTPVTPLSPSIQVNSRCWR